MADVIPLSVRQRFREALAAYAEQHPEMSVPECARAFVAGLMDDDLDLVREMITVDAQGVVAELLRRDISNTRNSVMVGVDLPSINRNVRRARGLIGPPSESLYERVAAWKEYVPSLGRHSTILSMRRSDLESSAQYDEQRVHGFGLKMVLKRELAAALTDDTQTVGDVFTAEQIHAKMEDVHHRLSTGALRLKVGPQSDHIPLRRK